MKKAVLILLLMVPYAHAQVSFINDVIPVMTRADCANSGCHGSVRGQNGFKLSLFHYDPEFDYEAITKMSEGRRIDRARPEESLLLKKPSFQVAHGGGQRFAADSPEYQVLLAWLKAGATLDPPGTPRIQKLSVSPSEQHLVGIGNTLQLSATATYSDGMTRDVTGLVRYSSNIPAIASVTPDGLVKAEGSGLTAIMVRVLGKASAVEVLVTRDSPRADYTAVPCNNFIDQHVFAKLQKLNILPSRLTTDEEFLRRVYLDTIGVPPASSEAEGFLASTVPDKRAKLIDGLLDRPEHTEVAAMRFADMFRAGYNEAGVKGGSAFYRWFRDQVRRDKPWDQMARELLVSQGRHDFEGVSNFYFVSREIDPEEAAVNVNQVLLGIQMECARCHSHPFEKWTQDDFYGFAAFFARVERKDMYLTNHNATYLKDKGEVIHPKTGKAVAPKYLDGAVEPERPGEDVREKLAAWVTSPQNPFFARAAVNRFWKFYMGRGLVEPVDDFRVTNPPTNRALLDALAREFVDHGYSIKHLERRILNSRTYQLASEPNATNRTDQVDYSHFIVRRLAAEQVIDSMGQVTGTPEKFPGFPLGTRAMAIAVMDFRKPHYMMKTFGRNEIREVICERDQRPNMAQVMHLVSGETLHRQITAPAGNLSTWLADPALSDRKIVEKVYLSALARYPSVEEIGLALQPLGGKPEGRRRAHEDLLWAVFNSKEFLFQH
jgi:hypothetical protein